MLLNGWKEIAAHFKCSVRTVQRWERLSIGLPVLRPKEGTGPVCAFSEDLDDWLKKTPGALSHMPTGFNHRILVVDDEPTIRDTATLLLSSKGYEVHVAEDGFAALVQLRRSLPDLIISDLRMPNMSGFELLSVVRRRFPHIPVIAISGEYNGTAPEGLIADTFFSKVEYTTEQLFARIAELLEQAPMRPQIRVPSTAPVWTPRNNAGYFVITCPQCLRSFSIVDEQSVEVRETQCVHCDSKVRYLAEANRASKKPSTRAS